jgi:hypothetical protein
MVGKHAVFLPFVKYGAVTMSTINTRAKWQQQQQHALGDEMTGTS